MIGRDVSLAVWALLGMVFVGGQVGAALSGGRLPGLGRFVRHLTAGPVGRFVTVLAWMWLGWHAFAR